jgi:hypothetical protein
MIALVWHCSAKVLVAWCCKVHTFAGGVVVRYAAAPVVPVFRSNPSRHCKEKKGVVTTCSYFSFLRKWSKFGIQVRLGPKNVDVEKHASIAQVLAL